MKKKIAAILGLALSGMFLLGGCGEGAMTALPYDDQIHPELDNAYNQELFFRNDLFTESPDPCIIRINDPGSTENGYYYMYATNASDKGFRAYRNKDLTGQWEDMTSIKNALAFEAQPGHFAYGKGCFWAPEVIYDEDAGGYYLFYSGAINDDPEGAHRMIAVAFAEEPYGPFLPVETDGLDASKPLFDNAEMVAWCQENGEETSSGYFNCIDPHPYVAPDGTKYLYFCHEHRLGQEFSDIYGMEMETWTKPIVDTLTVLARAGYDTAGEDRQPIDYEAGNHTDEGPYMFQKQVNGQWKYYLCLSINGYADKSYSVIQAIGDSPLGPFRKLQESEGGILLGTDNQKFDHISGSGHHSFIVVDGEIWISYHEHLNREGGLGERDIAVDRVVWTKNSDGLDVLYCNGPTWSLQPRISAYSGWKNIAPESKVEASTGTNIEALTDGMFTLYSNINYVKEFEAEKTTTITLEFEEYREITALMVYNSKEFKHSFVGIKRVEFDFEYEGQEGTAYIDDLKFNWDFYKMATDFAMRPGGSAVAVFNPLKVKTIRITVELPEERPEDIAIMDDEGYYTTQTTVAVSEIVVLGK